MHGSHTFLEALATVLCVAAVTTVVFQRLRQPVVLGYLLAGVIVGPYTPIPLVADRAIVQTLSELGVILLMFSLGLEFSLTKLARVGPSASVTAILECSVMLWLGFSVSSAFGWTLRESIFTGAIVAISSTTIIAKAFDEQGVRGKLRETVVSVLIVEDLIAILLMAVLTAMTSAHGGIPVKALLASLGKLAAFLAGLLAFGRLIVPSAIAFISRLGRTETMLVASMGICFASALLALNFGYSVALGAFLAGSLVAESGHEKQIERLVEPVRDMFAAIFFVSVGMSIDPHIIVAHAGAIFVLSGVVIVGKILGVSIGAFLTGAGIRMSLQAGMSLAQIGEFSFIIAGLGVSLDATGSFLYPVAVAVSAITTLTTPWLIRAAAPTATFVDRALPPSLQTFAALYASWLDPVQVEAHDGRGKRVRRSLVRVLIVDTALLALVVIAAALYAHDAAIWVVRKLDITRFAARALVIATVLALASPLCISMLRATRRLGAMLAMVAMPKARSTEAGKSSKSRRALSLTLQLSVILLASLPVLAVTQPFLRGFEGALVFGFLCISFCWSVWRSAEHLQDEVTAGVESVAAALSTAAHEHAGRGQGQDTVEHSASSMQSLLSVLGAPKTLQLTDKSAAVSRTLLDLNLRGLTGATVLAIARDRVVFVPTASEVLCVGDVLALAGSHEAVGAAERLLEHGDRQQEAPPDSLQ